MRDKLINILQDVRVLKRKKLVDDSEINLPASELIQDIETNTMAALHGGATVIQTELFGSIPIPEDIITRMSNGDDDLWFTVSPYIDVNIFYHCEEQRWHYNMYPVKNGQIETSIELEVGRL